MIAMKPVNIPLRLPGISEKPQCLVWHLIHNPKEFGSPFHPACRRKDASALPNSLDLPWCKTIADHQPFDPRLEQFHLGTRQPRSCHGLLPLPPSTKLTRVEVDVPRRQYALTKQTGRIRNAFTWLSRHLGANMVKNSTVEVVVSTAALPVPYGIK